jgi:2-hydroxy-3-keto-5-methylthiopentenyl-1-phosphate phosphatase
MPAAATLKKPILVSDFDGTMTRVDFYQLVRDEWWDASQPDPWEDYLAGRITHFDALNCFFARIRSDEASLLRFIERMELDPTLPVALQRLHEHGWKIVIASAGCEWYILHLLKKITVPFSLHANPGRFDPDRGLEMIRPVTSPFYSPQTGIDKVAIVRDAVSHHGRVAFAGDGPPDLPAARLVPGGSRFARGWLAHALTEAGETFKPLVNWAQLAEQLLTSPAQAP